MRVNDGTQAFWFLQSNNWILKELRKATRLPGKEMIARTRELLGRAEELSREVTQFLDIKDKQ